MKKLKALFLFLAVLVAPALAQAYTWGDLKNDVVSQSKLTVLQSAVPAYFWDVENGRPLLGVVTPVSTHFEVFSFDAGWVTPPETDKVGAALLGVSLHVDKLVSALFPNFSEKGTSFVPDAVKPFWDKVTIGTFTGRDLDQQGFLWGLYSGLEFKF